MKLVSGRRPEIFNNYSVKYIGKSGKYEIKNFNYEIRKSMKKYMKYGNDF